MGDATGPIVGSLLGGAGGGVAGAQVAGAPGAAIGAVLGGVIGGISGEQIDVARRGEKLRRQQLRRRETAQKLANVERSIRRQDKLEHVQAAKAMQLQARNVSPGTGTFASLTFEDVKKANQDEFADSLNLNNQLLTNFQQRQQAVLTRNRQISQSVIGGVQTGTSLFAAAAK